MTWATTRMALREEERGQTAVEYVLVIALVALVLAGAIAAGANGVFTSVWSKVTNAIG